MWRGSRGLLRDCETLNFAKVRLQLCVHSSWWWRGTRASWPASWRGSTAGSPRASSPTSSNSTVSLTSNIYGGKKIIRDPSQMFDNLLSPACITPRTCPPRFSSWCWRKPADWSGLSGRRAGMTWTRGRVQCKHMKYILTRDCFQHLQPDECNFWKETALSQTCIIWPQWSWIFSLKIYAAFVFFYPKHFASHNHKSKILTDQFWTLT